ncbi:MAG: prolipoprotein diacylglyceryl transferase [Cyclobacteriaceae bacterium]|nr:prolipoprotein diacylglyceryl transferase [Cyclobacteriaceae bacterium]
MSWITRLQQRWKVKSVAHVFIILLVFACTGFTVLLIKRPLFALWFPDGNIPLSASIAYWILIFPVYNLFLLFYGFLFGQFRFFWDFEKRFFARLLSNFKK